MEEIADTGGINFPYDYWHLISIYGEEDKVFLTSSNIKKLKDIGLGRYASLNFWDITDKDLSGIQERFPNAKLFNEPHAQVVIELLDKIQKEEKDSYLIVHCAAGISRSGAIGTFACDYCHLDYHEFTKSNPSIMANQYVLATIRKISGMTPTFENHDGIAPVNIINGIIVPAPK